MMKFPIFVFVAFLFACSGPTNAQVSAQHQKTIDTTMRTTVNTETRNMFVNTLSTDNEDLLIALFKGTHIDTQLVGSKFAIERLDKKAFRSVKHAARVAKLAKKYAPKEVGEILADLPQAVKSYYAAKDTKEFCEKRWADHTSPSFWSKKKIRGVRDEDSFEKSKPALIKFWKKEVKFLRAKGCDKQIKVLSYRLRPELSQGLFK